MSAGHAPAAWPQQVLPPDVEGWEQSAVDWLLDYGDPQWRIDPVLRTQPVLLARFALSRARGHVTPARRLWAAGPQLLDHEPGEEVLAGVRPVLARKAPG